MYQAHDPTGIGRNVKRTKQTRPPERREGVRRIAIIIVTTMLP